jgi:hypothetical protein
MKAPKVGDTLTIVAENGKVYQREVVKVGREYFYTHPVSGNGNIKFSIGDFHRGSWPDVSDYTAEYWAFPSEEAYHYEQQRELLYRALLTSTG